jgi:hypothetical protein
MRIGEMNDLGWSKRSFGREAVRELSSGNRDATGSRMIGKPESFDGCMREAMKAAERLSEKSTRSLRIEYIEADDVFEVSMMDGGRETTSLVSPDKVPKMIEDFRLTRAPESA